MQLWIETNTLIGAMTETLEAEVEELHLWVWCWNVVELVTLNLPVLEMCLFRRFREPVTQSGLAERIREAREELVRIDELAEMLADDENPATDAAAYRARRRRRKELLALVREGHLPAQRNGKDIRIPYGAFADWLGEEVTGWPEGEGFQVYPDDQADEVDQERQLQERVRESIANLNSIAKPGDGKPMQDWVPELVERWAPLLWQRLRVLERVAEVVANQLSTEDALWPFVREQMDRVKVGLLQAVETIEIFKPLELREPNEEAVDRVLCTLEEAANVHACR